MLGLSQEIRVFIAVAEAQNFSRAAQLLKMTQPGVSKAVAKLEKHFRLKVFIRVRHGVHLTHEGSELYRKLKGFTQQWNEIERSVGEQGSEIVRSFSLGCHAALGLRFLPVLLPKLLEEFPRAEWACRNYESRIITDLVIKGEIDFGIVADPKPHPELAMVQVNRSHFAAFSTKKSGPAASSKVVFFNPEMVGGLGHLLALLGPLKQAKRVPVTDYSLIAELIRATGGIGVLPHAIGTAQEDLVPLAGSSGSREIRIYLIFRPDLQTNPASKKVMAAIKKTLKLPAKA